MAETLLSVGIDVGTTTTQLIFSRLTVENRASAFAVPELEIAGREVLFESEVVFTPLLDDVTIDAEALGRIVARFYRAAGRRPEEIQTGAVIITGETARKENAGAVLQALAAFAGDFVVTTAGPELESTLAARGAGADEYARQRGCTVLHMDIGGGTSNLAVYGPEGLLDAGCLNVGGRLIKVEAGKITYVSPVLAGLTALQPGDRASEEVLLPVVGLLVQALEEAAGLRPPTALLEKLITSKTVALPPGPVTVSFSGGVAAAMENPRQDWFAYGDIGVLLARGILESGLCRGPWRISPRAIRATVIGAGCHSACLSGSTVYLRGLSYPLKNLPVCPILPGRPLEREMEKAGAFEGDVVFALPGREQIHFDQLVELARGFVRGLGGRKAYLALERDCAKAMGQTLAMLLPKDRQILCLDGLRLQEGAYLDVAKPLAGGAVPVVIKTLVL